MWSHTTWHNEPSRADAFHEDGAMAYTYTLRYKYQLMDDRDLSSLVERLGEAGCGGALAGVGQPGRLALEFTREAANVAEAVHSALADVRQAVPSVRLIEITPECDPAAVFECD